MTRQRCPRKVRTSSNFTTVNMSRDNNTGVGAASRVRRFSNNKPLLYRYLLTYRAWYTTVTTCHHLEFSASQITSLRRVLRSVGDHFHARYAESQLRKAWPRHAMNATVQQLAKQHTEQMSMAFVAVIKIRRWLNPDYASCSSSDHENTPFSVPK